MHILGLQKLTLLDYPGHLAAIVFLGSCNFRCPFCQNSSLVLAPDTLPAIGREEFLRFLRKRSGILEGICVTGGEPTLHSDLPELLSDIHDAGYLVKLDTNGTNPELLQSLISEGLVDYVAMDIKAGRANYRRVCGLEKVRVLSTGASPDGGIDRMAGQPDRLLEKVCRSVDLLKRSPIEYEFRTTVVRGLHTTSDFEDIASWLSAPAGMIHSAGGDERSSDTVHFSAADNGSSDTAHFSAADHDSFDTSVSSIRTADDFCADRCRYYLQSFRDCPEVLQSNHSFSAFSSEEMQDFLTIVQKKIPQASLRG